MQNNLLVLDASIAIKWFHGEPDSEAAERIRDRIVNGELRIMVPPLFFYEVANALTCKAGSEVDAIMAAHKVLTSLPFQVVEVIYSLLTDAIHIAHRHHLSVYDAIYVALAISTGGTLLTADERLARLIGGPTVQLLKEYEK